MICDHVTKSKRCKGCSHAINHEPIKERVSFKFIICSDNKLTCMRGNKVFNFICIEEQKEIKK